MFWTIVVEMRFYVVLPFLLILSALVLEKFKNGPLILILIASIWFAGIASGVIQHGYLQSLAIDKHAPIFVAGVLTALVVHTLKMDSQGRASKALFECVAWCSAVAFVCLSVPALYYAIALIDTGTYAETPNSVLEGFWDARIPWVGLVLGLLFFSYRNGIVFMTRLFGWLPLVWIGRVSYGVYLIHLTVLQVFVTFDLPATIKLILALIFQLASRLCCSRRLNLP